MALGEKTGGRQAGTPNRNRYAAMEGVGDGLLPLPYMIQILRDESQTPQARAWAAEKSAPFLYSKPAPEHRRVEIELPDTSTAKGVGDAIAAVVAAVGKGELAPAEGREIVSMLESRLKAFETIDFEERLKKLEERQS